MPKVIYAWKKASRVSIDAQKAGKQLSKLHKKNGQLTAEIVVGDAKLPASPLHDHFEWDDRAAAEEHRLVQARKLLNSVVILRDNGENAHPIRAFVHISDEDAGSVYVSIDIAMGDAVMRRQVLERAWNELEQWRQRYHEYEELAKIFTAIDEERSAAA